MAFGRNKKTATSVTIEDAPTNEGESVEIAVDESDAVAMGAGGDANAEAPEQENTSEAQSVEGEEVVAEETDTFTTDDAAASDGESVEAIADDGDKPVDFATLPAVIEQGSLADDLVALKMRARQELSQRMGAKLYERDLDEEQLETLIIEELARFLVDEEIELAEWEQNRLCEELINDVLHNGPIQALLDDPSITEVMVNSVDSIYIERGGRLFLSDVNFDSEDHLRQVIERIAASIGRRIDESSPMVDARLADGSRVNAIIPPLSVDGPMLTIRKFGEDQMTMNDLLEMGSISQEVAAFLAASVRGRINILVSGGTGSGKTTLLNVLSSFIPATERIITIEDAVELRLHQRHVIRLESRPPNVEGKGAVVIRDLVRNALRMRPDRIVVGECRGGETLDMLQAMNTGHDGSLSTLHANTPRDAMRRVETMTMMAGMDLPLSVVREQASSAIEMIVQVARLRDGSRRVTHISEVVGMEGDVVTLNDIFDFDFAAGVDSAGRFRGILQPTGIRPTFITKLEDQGISVPPALFSKYDDLTSSKRR